MLRLKLSKKSELPSSWIRRDVTADVAADGGILDLDHLRAEIGELHRRRRARRRTARATRTRRSCERPHATSSPAARARRGPPRRACREASSIMAPSCSGGALAAVVGPVERRRAADVRGRAPRRSRREDRVARSRSGRGGRPTSREARAGGRVAPTRAGLRRRRGLPYGPSIGWRPKAWAAAAIRERA